MPHLIRVMIRQTAIGFLLAAIFAGLLLWANVAGLRDLVIGTQGGFLALAVFWILNGSVFAAVQFALALDPFVSGDDEPGDGGGFGAAHGFPQAVRVRADDSARRPERR